jgi:predicted negative regulator of RcsB-dependent stress response
MATTNSSTAFGGDIAEQRFSELWDRHRQHIAWVGVVILLALAGAWFYVRSKSLKEQHAQAAYQQAAVSVESGNTALAESDLKKLVTRYKGTDGGVEGAMTLAKLYYTQGKYQPGIDVIKSADADKTDMSFDALILQGEGYEGLTKWPDAARTYQQAADAARFDADKAQAQAMAARALQAGGDKAGAIKIWQSLLDNPKSGFGSEAQVRLGELQAEPIKV